MISGVPALSCVPNRLVGPRRIITRPVSLATLRHGSTGVSDPKHLGCFSRKVAPLSPLNSRQYTRLVTHAKKNDEKTFMDAARDAAAGKPGLESENIDPQIRRRAEDAVLGGRCRVTIGDVASRAGLSLFEAENAVKALAADSQATLAVSNQGEILYCFPSNFKDTIRSKSVKLRLESTITGVKSVAAYFARALYGTALIASIATVTAAFLVLASSSKDDRDRGSRSSSMSFSPRLFFNITDLLSIYDPYYYQRRRRYFYDQGGYYSDTPQMSFVDAIFSFVFGDGDPNSEYERVRWEGVGKLIAARGGVVTAEELAPLMDVTSRQLNPRRRDESVVDESYVLPALVRFGGSPELDADGHILYRFPALQYTGDTSAVKEKDRQQRRFNASQWWDNVQERTWKITAAKGGQLFGAVALGVANLLGVAFLSQALTIPQNVAQLAYNNLGWVISAMPALQLYALTFFAIPAVRWLTYQKRNAEIEARNYAKIEAQMMLANPTQELQQKMASAANKAMTSVVRKEDSIYRSDQAVEEQPIDVEADTWERRLERRAQERDLEERGWAPAPKRSAAKSKSRIDK